MLSRIVLFSGALLTTAGLVAGCGSGEAPRRPRDDRRRRSTRSPTPSSRSRGDMVDVRNLTPAGAEPHDLELTPGDVRAVHDALLVFYLGDGVHARPGDGGEGATRPLGRSSPTAAAGRGQRRRAARRPPCLARSGALCRHRAPDRLGARRRSVRGSPRAQARPARRAVPAWSRPLCAPSDRHEPCCLRVSGRALRARADPARRARAGGGAVGQGSGASRRGRQRGPERRRCSPRRSSRRSSRKRSRARPGSATAVLDPVEGLTDGEIAAGADYFSVMRSNLAALRKALGCTS